MSIKDVSMAAAISIGALIGGHASAQDMPTGVVVRIAELDIDPARLDDYKAAVREEMADAVRLEPGVLAIYSVAEKDNPARLRFFEIYASDEAYRSHLESPHFKKYVAVTQPMITARKLIETIPVQLSAKSR
ncbi:putative quinol monooxygenase [Bosea vaviloviae]|uniref:Antibiotic biosynthesis monooxygenase n=1 Tax=Bosea vaviloviae TaxID=1526658 RepID=A0A1D7UAT0_9HYPH|nr:putative quinol monooxygenase [Bosea vaviloviae]AOO84491.1 antibiotic biosynthesis monooxygenase [Bosea vaviloviae]